MNLFSTTSNTRSHHPKFQLLLRAKKQQTPVQKLDKFEEVTETQKRLFLHFSQICKRSIFQQNCHLVKGKYHCPVFFFLPFRCLIPSKKS